jgi:hypothetical protein
MPIIAGIETFQEIGEGSRGDGLTATIISQIFICIFRPFREISIRPALALLRLFLSAMAWQKTFTLAKRSKGCHLVTEEVLSFIESGLSGVQV